MSRRTGYDGLVIYDADMTTPEYASLRVRPGVADDARRLVRQLAAIADRDVTQTEAIGAALGYALDHVGDVAARLTPPPGGGAALSDRAFDAIAGK